MTKSTPLNSGGTPAFEMVGDGSLQFASATRPAIH